MCEVDEVVSWAGTEGMALRFQQQPCFSSSLGVLCLLVFGFVIAGVVSVAYLRCVLVVVALNSFSNSFSSSSSLVAPMWHSYIHNTERGASRLESNSPNA